MFTPEEKELLSKYVTSTEANVYAVKGMEGMAGAAYARYSRAKGGFRETLLKEFLKEGAIDPQHADELIERILVAYGDDSVGELEGAHVSYENVSAIAEKAIVDHRIGGAFIVQSTRYVYYDQKTEEGNYRYYRDPKVLASPLGKEYVRVMDLCFDTYVALMDPLKKLLESRKPIEEAEYDIDGDGKKEKLGELHEEGHIKAFKRTYDADLRAKICDTLRVLLPLSTYHNVGVFGNGRFHQGMISSFMTSPYTEIQDMGVLSKQALDQIIPKYVKRSRKNEYIAQTEQNMQLLADTLLAEFKPDSVVEVRLMPMDKSQEEADTFTTALMLYAYCDLPLQQLIDFVATQPLEVQEQIRNTYIGKRANRRDRPGRALEDGYMYRFDLLVTFQVFKDLMRHRMSSQVWQPFTPVHGFYMPEEIKELGLESQVLHAEEEARKLYHTLVEAGFRNEAQYAVLHGHKTRWVFQTNDRALMHMLELRTTPQGHPEYRKVSQVMHQEVKKRSPWRAEAMQFVDYNDYYWSRADSEAAQRVKEAKLDNRNK